MGILGVNHIAFRTPDTGGLKAFYRELLDAEELAGSHDSLRIGHTLLVFFPAEAGGAAADPDELAFDADRAGFEQALERARRLGALQREPVEPTPWSRAFLVRDPDGRRIEITYLQHVRRGEYYSVAGDFWYLRDIVEQWEARLAGSASCEPFGLPAGRSSVSSSPRA